MIRTIIKHLFIPLRSIDQALPDSGVIVDLGCGEGFISSFLARNPKRTVIGIDQDQTKIMQAKLEDDKFNNLNFKADNILTTKIPSHTVGIVISDVLHHLSQKSQQDLLTRITNSLKKDAVIVIKEINRADVIRSKLSRLWDLILYPQDKINYLSTKEIDQVMNQQNFTIQHLKKHLLVPASIHLYICTKQ